MMTEGDRFTIRNIIVDWLGTEASGVEELVNELLDAGVRLYPTSLAEWEYEYRLVPEGDPTHPGPWFKTQEGKVDESVASYAKRFNLTIERRYRQAAGEPGPWLNEANETEPVESGIPLCNFRWSNSDGKYRFSCKKPRIHLDAHRDGIGYVARSDENNPAIKGEWAL